MGVTVETTQAGDNQTYPKPGDSVTMDYTGTLQDGTVFDSSIRKGRRFTCKIGVGQVIQGWDEGVPQMSLGEKAILRCTSDYAYGREGAGGVIPPNAGETLSCSLPTVPLVRAYSASEMSESDDFV
ncbi:unnamed protein product [Scytosiphon promiscuus]